MRPLQSLIWAIIEQFLFKDTKLTLLEISTY
jgi:hypothetical protein